MFTECYCTQFRRSANALTSIYDEALRPVGLKITQHTLLRGLDRLGSATYNEIAAELSLDKTTISRNIKLLIDAGWVEVSSDDDARYKLAKLSLAGKRVLKEAEPHWRAAQNQVEKELKKYLKGPARNVLLEALETLQNVGGER
ncbi:MarR family winged helix-turn-helix transcriptional regulator [Caballeronia insecticola]|uniref:Transcriptional regulator MarR family protein n=1 Tax=Caballeronia insecticola TaxID=758793 RepID=R4X250_9BURK|nr:MarR family winged helix-turn-helix transcriptional regulator [Caballeronia insecticola]BAN25397.1 transcriptional regulator MarR family protein [Caballeronia insecticola]